MSEILRAAVINDLSGFGRCSLTVSLPILSAMGIQACPLPTAVLSNHTGYESCYFEDFTDRFVPFSEQWAKLGLNFAGISTGFLGSAAQAELIERFIQDFADDGTVVLVDPAMADNGKMYSTCSAELCAEMKKLIRCAKVITPNLTEACLLADADYAHVETLKGEKKRQAVREIARCLADGGSEKVIITGVHVEPGRVENVVFEQGEFYSIASAHVGKRFAGTGDVFSAIVFGRLMLGDQLRKAVECASGFVFEVTEYSATQGLPEEDGIAFEPFLKRLI